jgi:hypothetical protein
MGVREVEMLARVGRDRRYQGAGKSDRRTAIRGKKKQEFHHRVSRGPQRARRGGRQTRGLRWLGLDLTLSAHEQKRGMDYKDQERNLSVSREERRESVGLKLITPANMAADTAERQKVRCQEGTIKSNSRSSKRKRANRMTNERMRSEVVTFGFF